MKLIGAFAASLVIPSLRQQQQRRFLMSTIAMKKPFAVIVQAEIQPDRMNEFLAMIELNAKESRKEPGCMRFDVLRDQSQENKFFFYELYQGPEAIDYHKAQPHYAMWANFKESGGVVSSVSFKTDGEFLS